MQVQQAARALMEGTLHRMKAEVRAQLVAAWAPRVVRLGHSVSIDLTSPQGVSVLVLAVLASRFHTPLQPHLSELVVKQLTSLLEHPSDLHRTAAAELLGKGYPVWKAHVADPPALIRTLFRLAATYGLNSKGGGAREPSAEPSAAADSPGAPPPSAAPPATAPNRFHAALLAVGMLEPRYFCRAMGDHAVHMGGPNAHLIATECL